MRIAVCDDERSQIDIILKYIAAWSKSRDILIEYFTYSSGNEMLYQWSDGVSFDMAFLDIKMNGMSGMDLARTIRKIDNKLVIVFTTGLVDYVFQGYDVQALNYLIKPLKQTDFFVCLDRAYEIIKMRSTESFIITLEGQSIPLLYNEIYSFEIISHYIKVESLKGTYSFKKKLSELEQELPSDRFYRCHRSFILNIHYVHLVSKNEAIMDNGVRIPISKSRWNGMNEAFIKHYTKGIIV